MATVKNILYPSIPLDAGQVQGWKDIPIKKSPCHDPLVPLGLLSPEFGTIATSAIYFGEHSNSPYVGKNKLTGSLLTLFVRQSIAQRLLVAERLLPTGYHLLVFDAYRPYRVQQSLYNAYEHKLHKKYPTMRHEERKSEAQKYVSIPSKDPTRPSPHNTGGTVDVVIVQLDPAHVDDLQRVRSRLAHGKHTAAKQIDLEMQVSVLMQHHARMLNFGTAFDHGGKRSALAYYESRIARGEALSHSDMQACNNRRLLYKVMTQAGFQPYFAEWWHFNAPETQMGAATAGLDHAIFGAMDLDASNRAHEHARVALHQAAIPETHERSAVQHWAAEIIAPSEQ